MKRIYLSAILLVAFLFFVSVATPLASAPVPVQRPLRCGVECWPVKTASDPDARFLFNANGTLKRSRRVTIQDMLDFPYPFQNIASVPRWSYTKRVRPYELNIYTVEAKLTAYKLEDDKDYHLVLEDEDGFTMIAEIPDPSCVRTRTEIHGLIDRARQDFDDKFQVTRRYKTADTKVRVMGIAMFDKVHGQRGVADNGIELHPVLKIDFR